MGVIISYFFVPEMKGFSLEQLDHLYENKVSTRQFKGYHFADAVLAEKENGEITSTPQDIKDGTRHSEVEKVV